MSMITEHLNGVKSGTAPAATTKSSAVGIVLEVMESGLKDDGLYLVGRVKNTNSKVADGDVIAVEFRGATDRIKTSWLKSNSKKSLESNPEKPGLSTVAKGSVVMLESCYPVSKGEDGGHPVYSSRWLNTIISHQKLDDHEDRTFIDDSIVTAPKICFKNPSPVTGEPASITVPVNVQSVGKVTLPVPTEHGTFMKEFSADWALAKLTEMRAKNVRPSVVVDLLSPAESVKVETLQQLKDTLATTIAAGPKALSMLRLVDASNGTVVCHRNVYAQFKKNDDGRYVADVDATLGQLFSNNIFKDVPTDLLAKDLDQGGSFIEVVPGYRLGYAGDPTVSNNASYKLIDDVINGKTQKFEVLFGKEPDRWAQVIMPGNMKGDGMADFNPFLIIANETGTFEPAKFGTHLVEAGKATPVPTPIEDAHPAESVAQQFDASMLDDETPKDEEEENNTPRP